MTVKRSDYALGVMYRCQYAPETLKPFVRRAESAGFDEVWVVEDCFFGGGISAAASALAFTNTIHVGLGIMLAVARNAAFTAMEIATIARLHPGRFLPGLGHGVAEWMRQIGAFPKSQLRALEETTLAVRQLLRGETVTTYGQHVQLDDVKLVFPPEIVPPICLGVRGPESLALAGRSADGTLLSEYSSPAYVRWAREQIARGQESAGQTDKHRVTVYVWCAVDEDRQAARQSLRARLAGGLTAGTLQAQLSGMGIQQEVDALLAEVGAARFAAEFPDDWIDALAVAGTPDDCITAIEALAEAGADSIVLVPTEGEDIAALERIAKLIMPALQGR